MITNVVYEMLLLSLIQYLVIESSNLLKIAIGM